MFTYMSMLVEKCCFDTVEANFMIVGHTHSNLDQYFSVLSGAIQNAEFIGSPFALWELLQNAHSKDATYSRPLVNRRIDVYYDMKEFFEPYRNVDISGYQIPFNFRFRRVCGKAIMQYKLFTTNETWLPKEPPQCHLEAMDALLSNKLTAIQIPQLSMVNGKSVLLKELHLDGLTADKFIGNKVHVYIFNFMCY